MFHPAGADRRAARLPGAGRPGLDGTGPADSARPPASAPAALQQLLERLESEPQELHNVAAVALPGDLEAYVDDVLRVIRQNQLTRFSGGEVADGLSTIK